MLQSVGVCMQQKMRAEGEGEGSMNFVEPNLCVCGGRERERNLINGGLHTKPILGFI